MNSNSKKKKSQNIKDDANFGRPVNASYIHCLNSNFTVGNEDNWEKIWVKQKISNKFWTTEV